MRNSLKTLLFLSAFSPVFLTLAYIRYEMHGMQIDVIQLAFIGVIGTTIPLMIMKLLTRSSESVAFSAKKIESNDFMLLAFVASYFVPIILKASDINMVATILVTGTIAIILWLVSSIPSHPLLRAFKFRFYKVESASGVVYTLISKRDILDPKEIKNVKKISSSMLMESK